MVNFRTAQSTRAPPVVASFGYRKSACRLRRAALLTSVDLPSPAGRQIIHVSASLVP